MAAAVLGISAFGSVPVTAAESTETADIGEAMAVDGEAVSSDLVAGTFKPSDVTCKAQDSYEYPFLGLKLSLSKELLKQIKDQSIAMLTTEDLKSDQCSDICLCKLEQNDRGTEKCRNTEDGNRI